MVPHRCRGPLCSAADPRTVSVGQEHAVPGENCWGGSFHRHRQCTLVAAPHHAPPASPKPVGAWSETWWAWVFRPAVMRPALGPVLIKANLGTNNRIFFPRDATHEGTHLAVLEFAESATRLLSNTHRLGPFVGERCGIKHDYAVGLPKFFAPWQGRVFSIGRSSQRTFPTKLTIPSRWRPMTSAIRSPVLRSSFHISRVTYWAV